MLPVLWRVASSFLLVLVINVIIIVTQSSFFHTFPLPCLPFPFSSLLSDFLPISSSSRLFHVNSLVPPSLLPPLDLILTSYVGSLFLSPSLLLFSCLLLVISFPLNYPFSYFSFLPSCILTLFSFSYFSSISFPHSLFFLPPSFFLIFPLPHSFFTVGCPFSSSSLLLFSSLFIFLFHSFLYHLFAFPPPFSVLIPPLPYYLPSLCPPSTSSSSSYFPFLMVVHLFPPPSYPPPRSSLPPLSSSLLPPSQFPNSPFLALPYSPTFSLFPTPLLLVPLPYSPSSSLFPTTPSLLAAVEENSFSGQRDGARCDCRAKI